MDDLYIGLGLGMTDDEFDAALAPKNKAENVGSWAAVIAMFFVQPEGEEAEGGKARIKTRRSSHPIQ